MSTTDVLALRYPDATDADDVPGDMQRLAEDVEEALPRGFIDEASDTGGVTLAVSGTYYELGGCQVEINAKATARRYRVIGHFTLNAGTAPALLSGSIIRDGIAHPIGRAGQAYLTQTGGPGQVTVAAVATYVVPAGTPVTFSAAGRRVNAGGATDSVTSAYIEVEDIGPG